MAIDKSRTSTPMKVGVILLVLAFVGGIGVVGIGGLTGGGSTPAQTATDTVQAQLTQINTTAQAQIQPAEQQLKTKPNDYATLTALANDYYDWAQQVKTVSPSAGIDVTIWARAVDYYKKALAVKPGDPSVATDMSIAQFYSNDGSGALATINEVIKKNPKFAPAPFNAGIFYMASGDYAKATNAFNVYLKIDPKGPNVAQAKQFLAQIKTAATTPPSTVTTGK
jgi:Flp pilus assembly protein TadD